MSGNQLILWSMLVIPWASLIFMKKEEIRRYMPVGLFVALSTIFIIDIGLYLKFWVIPENIRPLSQILPISFGALLVINLWIFKYTYGRFWLYVIVQMLLSFLFVLVLQPYLSQRGIWVRTNATNFEAYLPVIPHFILIYLFQLWLDGKPILSTRIFHILTPAANKPIFKNKDQ